MPRKPTGGNVGRPRKYFADPAEEYAQRVLRGEITAGPYVRKACERHLRDLEEQGKRGILWDWSKAGNVVQFFETCLKHGDGPTDTTLGQPFKLLLWQKFIIGQLYGWRLKDGSRRFRTAYIEIGKGAGKSPMIAGLALNEMTDGAIGAAEIFSAATGRDQAKIVFKRAELMLRQSKALSKLITVTRENMACVQTQSFFRPVSREAGSLEGHNVHLALIDEVHVHKNSDVCDTMQDGTKGRPNACVIEITNTGAGKHNVCYDHHQYSINILDGMIENDAWFAFICGLDKDDEWTNPAVWPKANPSLDTVARLEGQPGTISAAFLAEQVRKAEGMPARQRRIKRLNFCIWDDAGPERAIDVDVWKENGAPVQVEELLGRDCWGGLDLAAVNDLVALVLLFPGEDRTVDVLPFFWLPAEGLAEKERRDRLPYRQWVDQGFLELTPGNTIDDWFIARRLEQLAEQFNIVAIGYDRWGMDKFLGTLRATGVDVPEAIFRPVGQGYAGMGPCIKHFEKRLGDRRYRHGMHPVLTMCAAYAVQHVDPAGNAKWAKDKAEYKIDGIVAMTMAEGVLSDDGAQREAVPRYRMFVLGA